MEVTKHEEIKHLTGPLCKAISHTIMSVAEVCFHKQFAFLSLSLRDAPAMGKTKTLVTKAP